MSSYRFGSVHFHDPRVLHFLIVSNVTSHILLIYRVKERIKKYSAQIEGSVLIVSCHDCLKFLLTSIQNLKVKICNKVF